MRRVLKHMEKDDRNKQREKSPLKRALGVIAALAALLVLLGYATPRPAAWLLHRMFKTPRLAPPAGYAEMEEQVEVVRDVRYPSQFQSNTADVYLPRNAVGKRPVILWAHGGAYVGGDKTDVVYYATALASQGYVVVSANYALAPGENYPAPLLQMGEACRWLAAVQEEYQLDMERLTLAGDSAGAHLMAQFALVQTSAVYAALCGIEATPEAKGIKSLLLYCGPYDAARMGEAEGLLGFFLQRSSWAYFGTRNWQREYGGQISVAEHVTPEFPPAFITDSNTMSFRMHAEELAAALQSKNVPAETYFMSVEEEKTTHEYQFLMDTPAGEECFARTLAFLQKFA